MSRNRLHFPLALALCFAGPLIRAQSILSGPFQQQLTQVCNTNPPTSVPISVSGIATVLFQQDLTSLTVSGGSVAGTLTLTLAPVPGCSANFTSDSPITAPLSGMVTPGGGLSLLLANFSEQHCTIQATGTVSRITVNIPPSCYGSGIVNPTASFTLSPVSPQTQLQAQATVGVPFTLNLLPGAMIPFPAGGSNYSVTFQADNTTLLPPGLTLSASGILSGTPTTAGTYIASIIVQVTDLSSGHMDIHSFADPIPIIVSSGTGPAVTVQTTGLSFSLTAGGAPAQQPIAISNRGPNPVPFQASPSGGTWLTQTGGGISVPGFGQVTVTVTANPFSLLPGTYTGAITISGSFPGSPLQVPVVVTVTAAQPLLSLSQMGLFFRTSAGGPAPPAQSFAVSNSGVGTLSWTATASTFSGGSWLSASPANGQSTTSNSSSVNVQINPAGLAAGTYYGQVQVSSAGIPNSPQFVAVVLNVAASAVNVDPDVRPTALIFVGRQGGTNPAPQKVQLTNLGSTPVTYSTALSGTGWLSVAPSSGSILSGTPASPAVTATIGNLAPGVYFAQVAFVFAEPNAIHNVVVLLIVLPGNGGIPARDASGCTPTKLLPVFSLLGQSFATFAAWPSSIEVTVVDDCGTPVTSGSVVTSFSSGDEPVSLVSLNDGRWSGTWTPRNQTTASVSITAMAQTSAPALSGSSMIGGTANANPGIPLVKSGGVVNAASNAPSTPVAPGSYISIYGSALAQGLTVAAAPFPTQLGGTQVLLAGQAIPLYFTSDGQINALIPYGLATNATLQLVVNHAGAYSTPVSVTFADGGPAVFLNAQGAGIAVGVKSDGTQYLVDAAHPTTAGDALVIYCSGLGAVMPSVPAGSVSPGVTLASTVNPVTATIEGIPATVFFSGLAPGFAGLYQVNVFVPAGLTPSSTAPLVLTIAGQSSPAAPIAVH